MDVSVSIFGKPSVVSGEAASLLRYSVDRRFNILTLTCSACGATASVPNDGLQAVHLEHEANCILIDVIDGGLQ